MKQKEFDRLNYLSEKSLLDTITPNEFYEFSRLIKDWNTSFELNPLNGLYEHKSRLDDIIKE
jgi:hypothetical protein